MSTIKEILDEGTNALREVSDTARLDCEILLAHVLKFTKARLISESKHMLTDQDKSVFIELIKRRLNYEPVAYLVGKKEFYGLDIKVSPDVLIPRPETELLVDLALKKAGVIEGKLRVLDLGTGSGCIPVALATELLKSGRQVLIDAVDVRSESLNVAKYNIELYKLEANIKLIKSDWFDNLEVYRKYDLIISNPPYIAEGDKQLSKETRFEPSKALFSGPQGLDAVKHIILESPKYLKPFGCLLIEIGSGQGKDFPQALIHKDIGGNDRVLEISLSSNLN